MSGRKLSRRRFLGGVGLASGGIALSTALPWTSRPADAAPTLVELSDWSIDDMWGDHPRYAEPIGFARPPEPVEPLAACAGSIDALFHA